MIWVILYSCQKSSRYDYSANITIKNKQTNKKLTKTEKPKPNNQPEIPTKQQKTEALRKIKEQNCTLQMVNRLEIGILMDKWM